MSGKKKMFVSLCGILLGLCLAVGMSAGVVYAEGTGSSTDNRKLQNGSFEEGQTFTGTYSQPDQSAVPSWSTTAFQGKIELFRENRNTYITGVTLAPTNKTYAAELNADEESTLYQNVKTTPSSVYEWGLDHGARNGTDTMALVIGPKQSVDPSKPSKDGRDQLMQMVDWLIAQGKTSVKTSAGLGERLTVYSKKFAANGTFEDNAGNNAFSLTPSTIYTEEWHIWIMASSRATSGTNPWNSYGSNAEGSAGSGNGSGSTTVDLSKYYLYTVPAGQTDTLFGFVSVGYVDSTTTADKAKTYGNFLDNINFHLYHPLSGSTTTHGSAVVGGSDGTSSGGGASSGHTITVDGKLTTYVTDGEALKIQAIIEKSDADDGCEFVGVYYTTQDENGNPVTTFIKLAGNEIEDTGSLTDEQKEGKWVKSTDQDGNIIYTYSLKNVTTATDLHFVFIKSPTITYDPNGGKAYVVERTYNTDEADNVYSFKPASGHNEAQAGTATIFIDPYVSKAAEGQNDGWKFMGWLLTGDTVDAKPGYTLVNKNELGSKLLSAVHTIACDYNFSGVTLADDSKDTKAQQFKIYGNNMTLSKEIVKNGQGKDAGVKWNDNGETKAYANVHRGLTMVAQWRWRQAFVPQIKSGNIYTDSAVGGTVKITSVENQTDENYDAAYNVNGAKAYFAETDETVTAEATAKEGYTFEGWYDASGKLITTNSTYSYTETKESVKTYYARFAQSVTQTYIRQVRNGDSWENTTDDNIGTLDRYTYNDVIGKSISSTATAETGYTFVGWYDHYGNRVDDDMIINSGTTISYVTSKDATYYARFSKSTELVFNSNPPSGYSSTGSVANIPGYVGKEVTIGNDTYSVLGYTFSGWNTKADGKGTAYALGDKYTMLANNGGVNPNVLYAQWVKTSESAQYKVQHIKLKQDGTILAEEEYTYYGKENEVANATEKNYDGYTYARNYDDGNGHKTISSGTIAGNGSLVLKLYYTPNSNTAYRVEHYKVNTDETSATLIETETLSGTTNGTANATAKSYAGYTCNDSYNYKGMQSVATGTITGDGKLVLRLYYIPSGTYLTYNSNFGTEVTETRNGKVDQTLKVEGQLFTRTGYTFKDWNTNRNGSGTSYAAGTGYLLLANNGEGNPNVLYAQWEANTDTAYKVEHYKVNTALTSATLIETENLSGTTDDTANATAKSYTGYTYKSDFDQNGMKTVASGVITADGKLILKLYYVCNQYTITYNLNGGSVATANPTSYDITSDDIILNNPTKEGYTFAGWTGSNGTTAQPAVTIVKGTTGDKTFTANWTANTNTAYKVQHWQQNLNGEPSMHDSTNYTLIDTENLTGTTGASVTPSVKSYSGFTAPSTQAVTIKADGSLVVNYYYTRNNHTAYKVQHWQQNLNGDPSIQNSSNYTLVDTDNLTGTTGASVTPSVKSYNGFTAPSTQTVTIKADGSLVVNYYYTRNQNTVYKVQHWQQDLDGNPSIHNSTNYTLKETDNLTGTTGAGVTPVVKTYEGFTAPSTQTVTIQGDGSLVVDYYYTRNSYTVTLIEGTGIASTNGGGTYLYGASVTINATVSSGYTWKDWTGTHSTTDQGYVFTMPAFNVTDTANATANSYTNTLNYDANGGTGAPSAQTASVTYPNTQSTFTISGTVPTKEGYTFAGWYTLVSGGTKVNSTHTVGNSNYAGNQSATLYAQWIQNATYQVQHIKLDKNGVEASTVQEQLSGPIGTTVYATAKTYTGYSFDSTNAGNIRSGEVLAGGSLTLKLYYKPNSVTLTYKANGGTGADVDVTGVVDEVVAVRDETGFAKQGYVFKGWNTKADGKGSEYHKNDNYTMRSDSNVLYAQWIPATNTPYKVEHYKMEGVGITPVLADTQSLSGTTNTTATANPKNYEGYSFDNTITGTQTSGGIIADGSLVLKLYYVKQASYSVEHYKVSSDGTSGILAEQQRLSGSVGKIITAQELTTLTGYTYQSGFDQNGMKTVSTGTIAADGSLLLKLYYTPNNTSLTYKANYDGAGADVNVSGVVDQVVATKPEDTFTRSGFYFNGWNTKADGSGILYSPGDEYIMLANNSEGNPNVLYAQWVDATESTVQYKVNHVKLDVDGNVVAEELSSHYGATGATVQAIQKNYDGYLHDNTIAGTVSSGVVLADGSLILKLYYIPRATLLIYDPNGGEGTSYSYTGCIGEGFTVDGNSFTRQGYTFAGWNTKSDGADGTDYAVGGGYTYNQNKITLYAQWTPNTNTPYKVQHYKMDGIGMTPVLVDGDTLSLTGTTDTTVTANQNNYDGYVFDDTVAGTLISGSIRADGNLVLKLYYVKRAAYNIYHYKVSADGASCTLLEQQQLYEAIGKSVTADSLTTLSGYTYQASYNNNGMITVATGTVADGGSLVLQLYYTPKATSLTYYANDGSSSTLADSGKVDQTLTVRGDIFSRSGYVFKGWNTKADGSGTTYVSGAGYVLLADTSAGNPNVLYAQWQKQENANSNSASSDNKTTEAKPTEIYLAKDPSATAHPAPTGDGNQEGMYTELLLISAIGIIFLLWKKYRLKKDNS